MKIIKDSNGKLREDASNKQAFHLLIPKNLQIEETIYGDFWNEEEARILDLAPHLIQKPSTKTIYDFFRTFIHYLKEELKLNRADILIRTAILLKKGANKYSERNWEKASPESIERFKESFYRHLNQFLLGDLSEDHLAATFFNLSGIRFLLHKQGEEK